MHPVENIVWFLIETLKPLWSPLTKLRDKIHSFMALDI